MSFLTQIISSARIILLPTVSTSWRVHNQCRQRERRTPEVYPPQLFRLEISEMIKQFQNQKIILQDMKNDHKVQSQIIRNKPQIVLFGYELPLHDILNFGFP